jgi:Domain of unknown function (DUF4352)
VRRNLLIGCGALGALVVVVLVIVVVLAVVRGGPSNPPPGGGGTQGAKAPPSTPKNPQDTSNQEVAVGDTATLSDQTLVVNEAQPGYVPPNQFQKPESGNQFVRVNVTITNTSDRSINFNPVNFKLQDASGVQREWKAMTQLPTPLNYGSLAPNGTVTGNMVFEAPQGGTDLKLIYKPSMISSEQVTVDL